MIQVYVKEWRIYCKYNKLFHYLYKIDPHTLFVDIYKIDFKNQNFIWNGCLWILNQPYSGLYNIHEYHWGKLTSFTSGEERAIFHDWPNLKVEGCGFSHNVQYCKNKTTLYRLRFFNINKLFEKTKNKDFSYVVNEQERLNIINKIV